MYGSRPSKRQRRIKPIARIGAVDVTVRYDIHGLQKARRKRNDCSDECFDVLEGELLFRQTAKGNFYRDNSLHVMSCTEGSGTKLSFAGVAVTGFSPRTDVYEQGFVTQISGLCSVFNNSTNAFTAGEDVYVEFLRDGAKGVTPNGVPYAKQLVKLAKAGTPANRIGTCVKGGPNKSTIDIILHRSGNGSIPVVKAAPVPAPAPAPAGAGAASQQINIATITGSTGSQFKPSRAKKSRSSK